METQFQAIVRHGAERGRHVWLTQPLGGGILRDLSFAEALGEARRIAAYLRQRGYAPGSRIAIFSKNTAFWLIADLAIWMAGHVSVPVYPTLTAESIAEILKHSEARLIFVGKLDDYERMAPGLPADIDRIVMPLAPTAAAGVRWETIVAATEPLGGPVDRAPDDLATIVYTSGSTGRPKGVMHSFRTMSAARVFVEMAHLEPTDRVLSYLPLAHVAERAFLETPAMMVGFRVFFAESLDTFIADLRRARPTIFGSVPRLWMKFQSGIFEKMPERRLSRLLRTPVVRDLVAKKLRTGLGLDAVRLALCGSAPVPPALLRFYAAIGIEIREIYGMTENFGISHAGVDFEPGFIGPPTPGVTQRRTEEGELLVKSPGTMLGYFRDEAQTREMLDDEGFIHTGDRCELDGQGRLRITGRVKELFKTSKGKYVAPAPIENLLMEHGLVEQACVAGIGMPQPFALVVLSPAGRSMADGELRALLESLRDEVNGRLDPHERLDRVVALRDEWTTEGGMLTPTLKVKRSAIDARYGARVEAWYEERDAVVFG